MTPHLASSDYKFFYRSTSFIDLNSNKQPDFLIVGQGIAGTLLCHFLLAQNKTVTVLSSAHKGSSSEIAAGIVNPITGRRFVLSWRYDELFQFAKATYRELEELLGIAIWNEINILRAIFSQFEENEWDRRSSYPDYKPFIVEPARLGNYQGCLKVQPSWAELQFSAQAAMPQLISKYNEYLKERELLIEETFDIEQLQYGDNKLRYKDLSPGKIVFCEGAKAIDNKFFNYLPFSPTKGELLLIRIPNVNFEKMLKHNVFIVPIGKDEYWVGSTNEFEFNDEEPSKEGRHWLQSKLDEFIGVPYEILSHKAGIRPTVQDIRPFLGLHPEFPGLAIFNGLGTKGASLGPFFAKQMAGFLTDQNPLDAEADINRFSV